MFVEARNIREQAGVESSRWSFPSSQLSNEYGDRLCSSTYFPPLPFVGGDKSRKFNITELPSPTLTHLQVMEFCIYIEDTSIWVQLGGEIYSIIERLR